MSATFADLLEVPLRSGFTIPADSRGSGVRMLNMGELFKYPRIPDVEMARVSAPSVPEERAYLRENDLLFARRSLTLEGAGKCAIVSEVTTPTTWESSIIRARVDPRRASAPFLYYYFRSPQGRRQMETIVEQVAAAGIRLTELAKLSVPNPPLPEQQAIAEVLGALDDKIAANTRVAATADELIHTEFLRVARSSSYEGERFADIGVISGGGTPSTKAPQNWGDDVWWATPTDLTALNGPYLAATSRTISREGLEACSSKLFEPGAILMTSRATIGALAINAVPTAVNQGFIVVEPHDPQMRWWLFHQMRSRVGEFISWANGATFLELSRGTFKTLPVQTVDVHSLRAFARLADATHTSAASILAENRTLAATRDALLPQLMSGKLRVRDAEAAASAAGA